MNWKNIRNKLADRLYFMNEEDCEDLAVIVYELCVTENQDELDNLLKELRRFVINIVGDTDG